MNPRIKIITAPDIVFDQAESLLVVQPNQDLQLKVDEYCSNSKDSINLYVFTNNDTDIKWLLTVAKFADNILIDVDNCTHSVGQFLSYLLSNPNTYYRTTHMTGPWDLLNQNRFFDFPNIERENDVEI